MQRITGTHLYAYATCPRMVALDLHEDPARRRPPSEVEELALRRGRELEARLTRELGYATPSYPERDFAAGAAATRALLARGVPGVLQGVLLEGDRLGIADILRREDGASAFGGWHYVAGDIKSSGMPRTDQVLQVMFYARLLGRLQGRAPGYAFLTLRDGHEEKLALDDYAPVLDDVESRVLALRDDPAAARPFLSSACRGCRWSLVCVPELEARRDLSLLQGMTRGLRTMLEGAGVADVTAAAEMSSEAVGRRTHLEASLLRRLRKAAQAHLAGRPLRERRQSRHELEDAALVHLLQDAFAERVVWLGVRHPASALGTVHESFPASREQELTALHELVRGLPPRVRLAHWGSALPRWHEQVAWRKHAGLDLEARFLDLGHRVRAAAVWPGPLFGLGEPVRYALDRDPDRAGEAGAVGIWMASPDARSRLAAKGRADLEDLRGLWSWLLAGGDEDQA